MSKRSRRTSVRRAEALLVALSLSAGACAGTQADSAQAGRSDGSGSQAAATDGVPAVFDSSVVHAIEISYDDADYDAMIETFAETGEKEWIEGEVTIDGRTYERVGLRLKGNSSLAGLGGDGFGPGRGRGAAGATGGTGAQADVTTTTPEAPSGSSTTPEPTSTTAAPAENGAGGRGGFGSASANEPERLPWLIRLDEYVDGQNHQGYVDLVVRSNSSQTSLNEALALELLEEAGLASQDAASTSFSVNGSEPVLRLAIEHPDDDAWQDANFSADGALYKAESTGDWSYRGDDPNDYEDVFDQEGGKKSADLTPLIQFLQFINESDDDTFAAELPERLDVDSFATYLAMMDLVENFDDIDGPGNNSYLWWDADTEKFTVVPWDMNLALSGGGLGGFGGMSGGAPEGFQPPGDGQVTEGFTPPEGLEPPEGLTPPNGGDIPEGFAPPEGFEPPEGDAGPMGRGGGGAFGRSNPLVERFHDNETFEALYQEKLIELRESLIDSGAADEILGAWIATLTEGAADLVDGTTVQDEADSIRALLAD